MSQMQKHEKNHPLVYLGMVILGVFLLFYALHLNSILWNPVIDLGGRSVSASDLHKLGVNLFYYQNKPYSGKAVRKAVDSGNLALEAIFRDGILHHKVLFDANGGKRILIRYENEKIIGVRFWRDGGAFAGQVSSPTEIRKIVKELGYARLYKPEALL